MIPLLLWLGGTLLTANAQKPLCRERFPSRTDEWRDCRVQIGGLAIQGAAAFQASLGPTFEGYLTEVFNSTTGIEFEALPLNFNQNFDYVSRNALDYIYSNPAAYTCMMVEFKINTIASLMNFRKGNALDQFAGVIFSRVESNFSTVEDLRRAHVAAVSISGLGAMQLQQAELLKMGINIMTDVQQITFTKNQNKIVQDVQNGWADVGFVRTDMIDRSVAKGSTRWEYFKVINEVNDQAFPFKRSTGFTPEWPIGALPHVPPDISEAVGGALMRLDRDSADPTLSAPAVAGSFATWVPPMNYLDLLSMLEDISYYSPEQRKCLRSSDVLGAVNCPPGWVKQTAAVAFCPASQCKTGYQCLCRPCVKLKDPELVLTVSTVPTTWMPNINGSAIADRTEIASSCSRMSKCASVARGQKITWTLLDQISDAVRAQINQYRISSVELLVEMEGTWQALTRETVVVDGLTTERYVLNTSVATNGYSVVQLRINGQQAALSPVVMEVFEPVQQRVFCPSGHRMEPDGSCSPCPMGTLGHVTVSDKTGLLTPTCLACPEGQYQDEPAQSRCKLCGVGTITNVAGSVNCTRCPPGSSTLENEGAAQCTPCDAGTKAIINAAGQTVCQPCPSGSYSASDGSTQCLPCPEGSVASVEGSSRCVPCPAGSVAPQNGSSTCQQCPRGFHTEPNSTGVSCVSCGMGMTTAELGSTEAAQCRCPGGTFYSPSDGCLQCSSRKEFEGLNCPGGNEPPLQVAGFWVDVLDEAGRDYSIYRCRDALECPAGALSSCAAGREGKACNNCMDAYVGDELGTCVPCNGSDILPMMIACCVMIVAIMMLILMVGADRCQQSLSRLTVLMVFGQVIMAVQALSAIRQLSIRWVEPVRTILNMMKLVTFDFDLLQISCLFQKDNPHIKFSMQLFAYPGFVVILGIAMLIFRFMKRPVTYDVFFNINGILLFMLFITLTLSVWMPFQCAPNPNGTTHMSSNPGITCWDSSQHWVLVVLAIVGTLAYPVAILTWAAWTTIKYPHRVQSGEGLRLIQRHRFFFERFTVKRYYFGLILLLRNTAVALVPVVFVTVPVVQLVSMGAVLMLGLIIQSRLWPWRTEGSNRADMGSVCSLILVLLTAAPLLDSSPMDNQLLLSILLCISVLSALVCGVAAIAHGMYRRMKPKERFDAFLCHHKVGAGCLCRFMKLMVQKHSDASVFLDSDNLEDLDLLFDIVRCNCKNLVVILSPELLKRIWCAGEIVTAHRNNISIVPVYCDGFSPLTEHDFGLVPEFWTDEEKHLLGNFGITMDHVVAAYRHLQDLPFLRLKRTSMIEEQEKVFVELISNCKIRGKALSSISQNTGKPKILVLGGFSDLEALAACQVVETVIQKTIQVETMVVRNAMQAEKVASSAMYLVVVLTRGLLTDPEFIDTFVALLEAYQNAPSSVGAMGSAGNGSGQCLEFVIINADPRFEFPGNEFYSKLDMGEVHIPGVAPETEPWLAEAYRSLFSVLALPLSTHGSESLMEQQLDEVSQRFRKLNGSVARASRRRTSAGHSDVGEAVFRRHSSMGSRTSGRGYVMRNTLSHGSRTSRSNSTREASPYDKSVNSTDVLQEAPEANYPSPMAVTNTALSDEEAAVLDHGFSSGEDTGRVSKRGASPKPRRPVDDAGMKILMKL